MAFMPLYRDVDRRDVAYWIAEQVIHGCNVPTPEALRDRYGMSRPASYRWHQWARIKRSQFNARREADHAHAHQ